MPFHIGDAGLPDWEGGIHTVHHRAHGDHREALLDVDSDHVQACRKQKIQDLRPLSSPVPIRRELMQRSGGSILD